MLQKCGRSRKSPLPAVTAAVPAKCVQRTHLFRPDALRIEPEMQSPLRATFFSLRCDETKTNWPATKRDATSVGLCGGWLRPSPDPQQGGREARGGLGPRTDVGGAAPDARASVGHPGKTGFLGFMLSYKAYWFWLAEVTATSRWLGAVLSAYAGVCVCARASLVRSVSFFFGPRRRRYALNCSCYFSVALVFSCDWPRQPRGASLALLLTSTACCLVCVCLGFS